MIQPVDPPEPPVESPPPVPRMAFGSGMALLCFLAYMGGQVAGSVVVMVVAFLLGVDVSSQEGQAEILGAMVLVGAVSGLLAVLLLVRYILAGPIMARAGKGLGLVGASLPATALWTVIGGLNGVVIVLVWPLLVAPPTEAPDSVLVTLATSGGFNRIAFLLLALLLAPPIEEFVFRGVMMHGFMHKLRPVIAATIVTTIFVLLHVPEARHYWPAVIAIFFLAVITVTARLRTGSLLPAWAAHLAYNSVVTVPGFFV